MQANLITADPHLQYGFNEFGPIILALAVVVILGGIVGAVIVICGWHGARSTSVDFSRRTLTIVCR